jgi:hypothetical protein
MSGLRNKVSVFNVRRKSSEAICSQLMFKVFQEQMGLYRCEADRHVQYSL